MSNNDKSKKAANEQLMPCPFCGGKARVNDHIYFDIPSTYGIVCEECGAMSKQFYDTMGEAVAAWNTRKEANPVPHEMTAREFVATISDMCINQFPEGCAPCPLWVAGHGCGEKILPPEDTVAIVEAWAREHPERSGE